MNSLKISCGGVYKKFNNSATNNGIRLEDADLS